MGVKRKFTLSIEKDLRLIWVCPFLAGNLSFKVLDKLLYVILKIAKGASSDEKPCSVASLIIWV